MKKVLTLALALISILGFISCDPVASYEKRIRNSSGQQLVLLRDDTESFNLLADSTVLDTKSSTLIADGFDIGGSVDAFSDCPGFPFAGDTIRIGVVSNNEVITKLLVTDQNNWKFKIIDKSRSGGGTCKCTLEITEDMIADME